ncbi:MAG: metallophosphoesterase [Acidimicrobiia bacterium]
MLIGIMSDVHCNAAAMDRAVTELAPVVDAMLVAGDAVLQYRFSNEVVEAIREHDIPYVTGNHEWTLLEHGQRALSAPEHRRSNIEFMAAAPARFEMQASGKRLLMVHASPFPPYGEYLHAGSPGLARCGEVDADILVLGHTHVPLATRVGSTLVVNPGSLGQGGDPSHPNMVSYGILDTDSDEFTVHRFRNPSLPAPAPRPA